MKTHSERSVGSVKALEIELAGVEYALMESTQQLRLLNDRRQRLLEARSGMFALMGLSPDQLYRFAPATTAGRFVAEPVDEQEIARLLDAQEKQQAALDGIPSGVGGR